MNKRLGMVAAGLCIGNGTTHALGNEYLSNYYILVTDIRMTNLFSLLLLVYVLSAYGICKQVFCLGLK